MTAACRPGDSRPAHPDGGRLFCDVSSFYAPTAGGIRTYHDAKIEWFASQRRHRYLLIHPGPRTSMAHPAPTVTVATVYGPRTRGGYRLPFDWKRIHAIVTASQPDVLETGDPWFSGPLGLMLKHWWKRVGFVSSFFHGDPVDTYIEPWVARGTILATVRRRLAERATRYFFRAQRAYDLTVTSSATIEAMLRRRGVHRILHTPFGVDPLFLDVGRARQPRTPRTRLLYAGRLQDDKGIDVLAAAIPRLVRTLDVQLTIVGTGPMAEQIASFASERVRVLGFVASRDRLARIYADHDVLLAPGAYESFGLATLEGLAAGLSVVGPDAGGTHALLAQLANPHVFKAGDPRDFVRAITGAIAADTMAEARAGVALAEQYGTWHRAIGAQVDSYCRYLSPCTT